MRTLIIAATLALVATSTCVQPTHAQVTCQQIGHQQYCSNGLNSQDVGNFRYYNDGTTRQTIGTFQYYTPPPVYNPPPMIQPVPIQPYRPLR